MKAILVALLLCITSAGMACPFCNSTTAKAIRASLGAPDLPFNVLATCLPFIIFFCIAWLIYHGGIPVKENNASTGKNIIS
jgi:hypothetical protein